MSATATATRNTIAGVAGGRVGVVGEPSATTAVIGSTTGDGGIDENFVESMLLS